MESEVIEVPEAPPRRTDRRLCDHCGASAATCRSHAWLSGRACCQACDESGRDHDNEAD